MPLSTSLMYLLKCINRQIIVDGIEKSQELCFPHLANVSLGVILKILTFDSGTLSLDFVYATKLSLYII